MKNRLLISACCVLLLCVSSCVTNNLKCPQFSAKRPGGGVHYTASKHIKSKPKTQSAPAQARKLDDSGMQDLTFGGLASSSNGLELKIPKMFTKKITDNDIEEANRIYKSASDNRVMLVKRGHKLFFKAKSAADAIRLMKVIAKKPGDRRYGGGGGGGIALAAGILGIIAFVLAFGPYSDTLAVVLGIIAIILGIVGLSSGRLGWALIGIIFGILALAIAGVFFGVFYIHIF